MTESRKIELNSRFFVADKIGKIIGNNMLHIEIYIDK
jgi:hypothetical protein